MTVRRATHAFADLVSVLIEEVRAEDGPIALSGAAAWVDGEARLLREPADECDHLVFALGFGRIDVGRSGGRDRGAGKKGNQRSSRAETGCSDGAHQDGS